MLVVKIGGCNGSGKTSLAREIMKHYKMEVWGYLRKKVEAYKAYGQYNEVYMLGGYETVCGGMDTFSNKEDVRAIVESYANPKRPITIFFEGLITGKTYGYLGNLSEQPGHKGRWIYVFLDTPFHVCVERVLQRRAAKGNTNPFDPQRTMMPTFKSIQSTARRAEAEGHPVLWLDHKLPPDKMAKALIKAVNNYDNKGSFV